MMRRFVLLLLPLLAAVPAPAEIVDLRTGGFEVVQETVVPGTTYAVYDEITGDVSGWWDHTMSDDPARLVIDARPGGHFYEHFDESGENGAIHATVIYADRGKKLVFRGPLGFSGHPLELVVTWELTADGVDRTRVKVTCRGEGELQEGWAEAVDDVWHHWLIEQFRPWMENLAYGG
jgi:hypothetical protein